MVEDQLAGAGTEIDARRGHAAGCGGCGTLCRADGERAGATTRRGNADVMVGMKQRAIGHQHGACTAIGDIEISEGTDRRVGVG